MQKISTQVFMVASITFGIIGLCLELFGAQNDNALINQILMRILMACVFIILPSFALSVAGKYLSK